jgi:uncharacterized protein
MVAIRMYNSSMQYDWDETKRLTNLADHGLDFAFAAHVFDGLTFTFEDDRFDYNERRFVSLGLLHGTVVSIVHTENEHEIRIISFRKATRREIKIYREEINRY